MAVYTQLISSYDDGETIYASLFTSEFNQIIAAFDKVTGHNHNGTIAGSGAPITTLYGNTLTLGTGSADVRLNFNAGTNDGVLIWKDTENKFMFHNSVLIDSPDLGNAAGDEVVQLEISGNNLNNSILRVVEERDSATSTDWLSTHKRIEFAVDTTRMSYIAQNFNGDYGLEIGSSSGGGPNTVFSTSAQPWISMKKAATGNGAGAVELYYGDDGTSAKKLETQVNGINVTGSDQYTSIVFKQDQSGPHSVASDLCRIQATWNEGGTSSTYLDFMMADDDGDGFRFRAKNYENGNSGSYYDFMKIGFDPLITARDEGIITINGGIRQQGHQYNLFVRDDVAGSPAIYVQQTASTGRVASFRFGSANANAGTEVLGVLHDKIEVTGGVTANYLDLTGGESTTTTGSIACKQIILNDPTGDGVLGTDSCKIYTEEGFDNQSKLVIHCADDGNDQIVLRIATNTSSDVLVANASGIAVTGTISADGVTLGNDKKITLGGEADGKLEIYEATGGNSVIEQTGTGELVLKGQNGHLRNDANDSLVAWDNAKAELYWRGATGAGAKLATTETGVDVTGTISTDGVALGNDERITLGGESDGKLEIFESTAGDGVIKQTGAGSIAIQGQGGFLQNDAGAALVAWDGSLAELSWRGATGAGIKLQTAETGIDVTGTITADAVTLDNNQKLKLGGDASPNLEIFETAAGDGYIGQQGAGNLVIQGHALQIKDDDGNLRFQGTNGSLGNAFLYYGADAVPKLNTVPDGIEVTGTVTTDLVKLNPTGGTEEGGQIEFQRAVDSQTAWYVDVYGSGTDTSLRFVDNDDANNPVNRVLMTNTGINVTGTVECKDTVAISTTGSGGDPAPDLDFINLHDYAIDERLGQINYYGMNDESGTGTGQTKYAWTEVRTIDVTEDFEKAQHETWVKNGANHTRALTVKPTGIDVTGTVTCDEALTISSTGAAEDAKPDIWLFNNATAAVDERLGQITWFGKNNATPEQESQNYAFQEVKTTNVGDGTEQAEMQFHIRNGANHVEVLTLESVGIDVTGKIECDTSLQITSSGSDVDAMPDLYMTNIEGAAAGQNLGMVSFRGYNLAATPEITNYADVYAQQVVVTDGAEEGKLVFDVLGAGAKVEALQVTKDGIDVTGDVAATTVTVGDGTSTDLKLYKDASDNCFIEQRGTGGLDVSGIYGKLSNESNQELISWDADNAALSWRGATGAGIKLFTSETGVEVTGTVAANSLVVTDTDASDRTKPEIRLKKDALNSDGDTIGQIVFSGDDKWDADRVFAEIVAVAVEMPANEYQANNDAITGAIHFNIASGGTNTNNPLEAPACIIDTTGVHINRHQLDGTTNTNYFHIENINLAGTKNGGIKYHSHTEGNVSNKTTKLLSKAVTQDAIIELPNVTGTAVVAAIAGGSINGGDGTSSAKTTWSESDVNANINTTYLHYNAVNTTDLTVSPDYPDNGYGDYFKFVNASPVASDIVIDLDGYAGTGIASYALTKTDGSLNATINTLSGNAGFASTITVAPGGYVILTKVAYAVYMVEGIGYTYS